MNFSSKLTGFKVRQVIPIPETPFQVVETIDTSSNARAQVVYASMPISLVAVLLFEEEPRHPCSCLYEHGPGNFPGTV